MGDPESRHPKNAGWLGPTSRQDRSSQERGSHPTRLSKIMGWGFPPV